MNVSSDYPKKILVECHHGIGDVVMTFPALRIIHEKDPHAEIHMILGKQSECNLVDLLGFVSKYYVYDRSKDSVLRLFNIISEIRLEKYDVAFAFGQSPRCLDVALLNIGKCKSIYGVVQSKIKYKGYQYVDCCDTLHRIEQHVKCVKRAYGISECDILDYSNRLSISPNMEDEINLSMDLLCDNKKIGLCIGAGSFIIKRKFRKVAYKNVKEWPIQYYDELIRILHDKGYSVILFGGFAEKKLCFKLKNLEYAINTVGQYTLLESLRALDECSLVIGNDTGLMHCASELNKRTITLFGPTDSRIIGPYGSNAIHISAKDCTACYGKDDRWIECDTLKCMRSISISQVVDAID